MFRALCAAALLATAVSAAPPRSPQPAEEVTFTTADAIRLSADYYAPPPAAHPAPVAILLHDAAADRTTLTPLAQRLQSTGWAVLAPDLRGHGRSATSGTADRARDRDESLFAAMNSDLRAAYDWLAERDEVDRARFALVGVAAGGAVALHYAVDDRSVDAIVCISPTLTAVGLDAKADLRSMTGRRVLLLTTDADRADADVLQPMMAGTDVRALPGESRGAALLADRPESAEHIARFLTEAVGRRSTTPVCGSILSDIYHAPDTEWARIIKPSNLRAYSSPAEAESRGLRASKTRGPIRPRP
jgi:dienelactone hydrolase